MSINREWWLEEVIAPLIGLVIFLGVVTFVGAVGCEIGGSRLRQDACEAACRQHARSGRLEVVQERHCLCKSGTVLVLRHAGLYEPLSDGGVK